MRIHLSTVLPLAAAFCVGAATPGCSSAPEREVPDASASSSASSIDRRTSTAGLETTRSTFAGPWEDPSSPLYNRTIYFDYNTSEIKPEFTQMLREHARYLGTNRGTKVTLEGHGDERGTREYNLALSDQRSDAVRRFMVAEGVPPTQISTLSYGEERPADLGHSEESWRLNRRVIIQY
jgi:peptidoglycan-associated lipoprotein